MIDEWQIPQALSGKKVVTFNSDAMGDGRTTDEVDPNYVPVFKGVVCICPDAGYDIRLCLYYM